MSLSLLAAVACENTVKLTGTVRVPPDVQGRFNAAAPGAVYLSADIPKTGFIGYRLAKEGPLTAWAAPLPSSTTAPACGVAQERIGDLASLDTAVATATTMLFQGNTGNVGCSTDEAFFDLTLVPALVP